MQLYHCIAVIDIKENKQQIVKHSGKTLQAYIITP